MSRYFFGVAPPTAMEARLEVFRGRWGHPHHDVEPHVTVKAPFVWNQEPALVLGPVRMACNGLLPFPVRLGAPARFPDAGVLFLSVESEGLPLLHRAVVEALAGLVEQDRRGHEGEGYHPHLTLAVSRFGIDPAGLAAMEREAALELAGLEPFTVRSLRCYCRNGGRDRWEPLCDLPLG
ncbi:MAG TPA: 2'-5' RNA ligase family protein [Symbiobacteriaceae bacterium]